MIIKGENFTIYKGDSLKILPTLKDAADLLLTDAPYPLTSGGESDVMGGKFSRENYDNSGQLFDDCPDWSEFMAPCFEALKDPAHAYFMCNNRNIRPMLNAAHDAGFYFHNMLDWNKVIATQNRWYMKNLEFIGFFGKGNAFEINDCGAKQSITCPPSKDSARFDPEGKGHPTEKPVTLMQFYIEQSTKPGQIVLDPFMGSGATGVAAIQSGRKFIGIDMSDRWFDVSHKRLLAARDMRTPLMQEQPMKQATFNL